MAVLCNKCKRLFGRRKLYKIVPTILVIICLCVLLYTRISQFIVNYYRPDLYFDHDLSTYIRSRSLEYYMNHTNLLIEPSNPFCQTRNEVPLLIVVISSPSNAANREAIRKTWGSHFEVYFLVGLPKHDQNEQMVQYYMESNNYQDIVVYDFIEDYQNLTLKTALLLRWTIKKCPHVDLLHKLDDDRMINPWIYKELIIKHEGEMLWGRVCTNVEPVRDGHRKWYLPKWLYPETIIPKYLSGPGYFINGKIVKNLYEAALKVPMINIEDIYYTYLVAQKYLNYTIVDEETLELDAWIVPLPCSYWSAANSERDAAGMLRVWEEMRNIGEVYEKGQAVCKLYNMIFGGLLGY